MISMQRIRTLACEHLNSTPPPPSAPKNLSAPDAPLAHAPPKSRGVFATIAGKCAPAVAGVLLGALGLTHSASASGARVANIVAPSPIEAKIDALLATMTLEQKVAQMTQLGWAGNPTGPEGIGFNIDQEERIKGGVGSLLNVTNPRDIARLQALAMKESPQKTPLLIGFDVIYGTRTIGPVPIAMASSFDPAVARSVAKIAGTEARARGIAWTFAPMVDYCVDPRWGRIVESWGSAPHLIAAMGSANVKGFKDAGVASTMKHFAGYGMAQGGIDYGPAQISRAQLHNEVLPPFRAMVQAGVHAVMPSFNVLNGVPAHANKGLLQLLDKWGFKGVVISDWAGVHELVAHGVAKDRKQAALLGLRAGVHMDMASDVFAENAPSLVKQGKIAEKQIDEAVRRILRLKLELGLFDDAIPDVDAAEKIELSAEHKAVMRNAAERSMVLLKNDVAGDRPVLPLGAGIKKIAVVGPLANDPDAPLGHWRGLGRKEDTITVLEGLKARAEDTVIAYAQGSEIQGGTAAQREEALRAAEDADVIIAVVGESAQMSGEAATRLDPSLPAEQVELLKKLSESGKPIVAVIMSGRPLTGMQWLAEHVPAMLQAWQPGTMAGEAIANVLFGSDKDGRLVTPGGKLSSEILPHAGFIGAAHHMRYGNGRPPSPKDHNKYTWGPAHFDEKGQLVASDPRHAGHGPLFAFGEGKSYTTFAVAEPSAPQKISKSTLREEGLTIRAKITNTGEREGDEVVQVYLRPLVATESQPEKKLVAFERLTVKPGESREVVFNLRESDLEYYSESKDRRLLETGDYKIWVGSSSRDKDLHSMTVTLTR
jgi:beta-glucosidase